MRVKCNGDCFHCPYEDCITEYKGDISRLTENRRRNYEYYHGIRIPEKPPKRKVRQLSNKGAVIRTYESIQAAAESIGANRTSLIQMVCAGKGYHKTAYGYRWEYADE